jgi:hypothetical protein
VSRAKVAYKLQIDPLRKLLKWVPAWSRMEKYPINIIYEAHGMRVAHVRR